ncbi:tRNA (adenosine(37)-N6)-threonylcarbamoyltransferase complex ATPase subunit type 1 TsaE [Roseospira navarrensis]|uniref:tRNA threonylcarbamoyladenosine biosynthesis protein TsaE n=1 Tax=Roseospira navarrensis TaxID=140058 RepID=A0A7X2D466_9PROT|nr:tRNA (adenosine(37)-N6)-threonylcarbamoyltransferase complex ATPase subunit type 1 TsaE [Roseospira navarrensis]MQX37536.1 tRNA (adenosine(37)-N6)-threonylcarbamoyltransferase complex ATPase subunit type 1 TsaE [Roseospira navarrensis]
MTEPTLPHADTALTLSLPDEPATVRLGGALADLLRRGDMVALRGDLGAGKTALARAIVRALTGDPDEDVPSPTFTLVQMYDTPDGTPVYHYDLYRLEDPAEALELDLEDALADGITLMEWPDRLAGWLPRDRLDITLGTTGPTARRVTLAPAGAWTRRADALSALRKDFAA